MLALAVLGLVLLVGVSHPVNAAYTPPSPPVISVSPATIDYGQNSTLRTTTPFSGGTPPYKCQWFEEAPGADGYSPFGSSFSCTISSHPAVSTGSLSSAGNWSFFLQVTDHHPTSVDSAVVNVTVNPALEFPTVAPSAAAIDTGQSVRVTVHWDGGTSPFTITLYKGSTSSCSSGLTLVSAKSQQASSPYTFSGLPTLTANTWYCASVTDGSLAGSVTNMSSSGQEVTVNPSLVAPTISVSPGIIDAGQSSTLTTTISLSGGTPLYACQWLEEAPGAGSYSPLGSPFTAGCTTSSKPSVSTGTLLTTGTWSFELQVTDSSGTPETVESSSVTVAVNPSLVAPTISVSPGIIDAGQSSTLTTITSFSNGTSPYNCQWLQMAPGAGNYSPLGSSFSCDTSSTPSVSTGALSTLGVWSFELQVTDSSGTPAPVASVSVTVTVNPTLTAPTISASPGAIDAGQSSTLTTTVSFSGGTSPYNCQWLQMAPGAGNYSPLGSSFSCDTSSTPSVSTGALSTLGVWSFELQVNDSSSESVASVSVTVTVNPTLTAPTISASPGAIDAGQSSSLTTITSFSNGTSPYTCQWLRMAPGAGSYSPLGNSFTTGCTTSSKPSVTTGALLTTGTWSFELQVNDSSSESVASGAVTVTVGPALIAPTISVSPAAIGNGQSATLSTTTSFTGGRSPYTCQWLEKSPTGTGFVALGGPFTTGCTLSSKPSVSTGNLTLAGNWSFELQVEDAASARMASSPATVTVSGLPGTSVTLSCGHSSLVVGSATICKAKVHGSSSAPTGNVTWSSSSSGTFSKLTCKLSMGACHVKFEPTAAGSSVILTANYGGDSENFPSSGTYNLTVTMKATKIMVSCSPKSAAAGSSQVITCTAKVIGYRPTGTVDWSQTTSSTGSVSFTSTTCTLASLTNPNRATCFVTMTGSTSGRVIINATYVGDSNNKGSFRTRAVTIKKASTVTAILCTESSFGLGTPITCTATVSGSSPTGTVTWSIVSGTGSVTLSSTTCTLSSGSCSVTVTATHTGGVEVKVAYSGDSNNFKSAGTLTLTIV